jgi:hypothetical protein
METNLTNQPSASADLLAIKQQAEQIKAQLHVLLKETANPRSAISQLATGAIIDLIEDAMGIFEDYGNSFTPTERMRKNSLGIRNYGFTQVAYANALRNPQFVPSYLDIEQWKEAVTDFQRKRDIWQWIRQFSQMVRDGMRVPADAAFGYALEYYGALREAARRAAPGAQTEFAELRPFFRRTRQKGSEPTAAEIERDLHALMHGTKDGEIVVRNERARMVGGKHEVIDTAHREHGAVKEVEQAEVS